MSRETSAKAFSSLTAYHPAFVRENTREAWDLSSKQRLDFSLPAEPEIVEAKPVASDGGEAETIEVRFSDGHVGLFDPPAPARDVWAADLPMKQRQVWGSSQAARSVADVSADLGPGGSLRFAFADLCGNGGLEVRRRYIEAMHVHGIAMVDGMPSEEDAIIEFGNCIQGFISPSCYGYKFTIESVDNPNNLAFSSASVQMHTDLPYYSSPPSIQLFHCLAQATEGGESLWLDGFDCAATLIQEDPEAFKILCEAPLRFMDLTDDWHVSALQQTFQLGHGRGTVHGLPHIQRVHFNERARDSWRDWSLDGSKAHGDFYRALRKFECIVEQRERYAHAVLQPGEMICTDNHRTLHSRGAFKGARHFKGGYLNWDDLYGRWRATAPEAGLSVWSPKSKL